MQYQMRIEDNQVLIQTTDGKELANLTPYIQDMPSSTTIELLNGKIGYPTIRPAYPIVKVSFNVDIILSKLAGGNRQDMETALSCAKASGAITALTKRGLTIILPDDELNNINLTSFIASTQTEIEFNEGEALQENYRIGSNPNQHLFKITAEFRPEKLNIYA